VESRGSDTGLVERGVSPGGGGYLCAVGGPVTLEQILLEAVLVTIQNLGATVGGGVRPHVPDPQAVVLQQRQACM